MRTKLTLLLLSIIVAVLLVACGTGGAAPSPSATPGALASAEPLTLTKVEAILTPGEIEEHLPGVGPWEKEAFDFYAQAEGVDPAQVVNMDSWWGVTYSTPSGSGITVTVIDFKSVAFATEHMLLVSAEMIALPNRTADEAFVGEGGGIVVVAGRASDKLFMFNADVSISASVDATLLSTLAETLASRL
jgi:hypothetical protein